MDHRKKKTLTQNPRKLAGLLSRITFWWVRDLYKKGLSKIITEEDVYQTSECQRSAKIAEKFTQVWNQESQEKHPSVFKLIFKTYGYKLLPVGLAFSVFESLLRCAQPLFFGALLSYFSSPEEPRSSAYIYATGMIMCSLIPIATYHPFYFYSMETAKKIKIGLTRLVYDKVSFMKM